MSDCTYCGEEPGQVEILNPNTDFGKEAYWYVCITCDKVIKEQMKMSFGFILQEKEHGLDLGKKLIKESVKELDRLGKESGKEIFGAVLRKKKE